MTDDQRNLSARGFAYPIDASAFWVCTATWNHADQRERLFPRAPGSECPECKKKRERQELLEALEEIARD